MAEVTFQLIEGLGRGHSFVNLATPFTIGREDENAICLNDDRISRFHVKIQADDDRVILTDLDSTNGTYVNGHPVQMRVLQIGDLLAIGRCLLVYGSREQLAKAIGREPISKLSDSQLLETHSGPTDSDVDQYEFLPSVDNPLQFIDGDVKRDLFPEGPPEPPQNLRPVHCAEISDFLSYIHEQIAIVLQAAAEDNDDENEEDKNSDDDDTPFGSSTMRIDSIPWQRLLQLEMDLVVYLRQLTDPDR